MLTNVNICPRTVVKESVYVFQCAVNSTHVLWSSAFDGRDFLLYALAVLTPVLIGEEVGGGE